MIFICVGGKRGKYGKNEIRFADMQDLADTWVNDDLVHAFEKVKVPLKKQEKQNY